MDVSNARVFYGSIVFYMVFALQHTCAQINIIDVPSAEVCEAKKMYFQQSIQLADRDFKAGTIFTWGLGKSWEAGFNIQQLTFHTRPHMALLELGSEHPEEDPHVLANLKKAFHLSDWALLGLGTQTGVNIADRIDGIHLASFHYVNSKIMLGSENTFLVFGGYYVNKAFAGEGNNIGYMAGGEWELIKNRFGLVADFISGHNAMSVINMGMALDLPKSWELDIAYQVPTPQSDNPRGIVLQVSRK